MIDGKLRERIVNVLHGLDGYGELYEVEINEDDDDYPTFSGASKVNWISFLITLLYLKLEKDGEVPSISSELNIVDEGYTYVPFIEGDTDVSDEPKCALIKKCLEEAGFAFPRPYNYLPDSEQGSYGYTIYTPESDAPYSVHSDDITDLNLGLFLSIMDSHRGVWGDDYSFEEQAAIRFLKKEHLVHTGEDFPLFTDYAEMTDEEFGSSEFHDDPDDALATALNGLRFPFGVFCMYHPKWQKVRAVYYQETARANAANEAPHYPFSLEEYRALDDEVHRIIKLGLPLDNVGLYYDMPDIEYVIDGAPVLIQMIPDVNTEPDEGYGHNVFLVNPLFYISPEFPLTYKGLKERIDMFYSSVFPGNTED